MSRKASSNIINIENEKSLPFVPYSITRNVMKQDELEKVAGYDRHKDSRKDNFHFWRYLSKLFQNPHTAFESICDGVKSISVKSLVFDFCPALKWLPEYPFRKNIMSDFVAGFTGSLTSVI
jgi:hypothetical protein